MTRKVVLNTKVNNNNINWPKRRNVVTEDFLFVTEKMETFKRERGGREREGERERVRREREGGGGREREGGREGERERESERREVGREREGGREGGRGRDVTEKMETFKRERE